MRAAFLELSPKQDGLVLWSVFGGKIKRRTHFNNDTVDGRNPAPVDMIHIPLLTRFLDIPGGARFLPSTVGTKNR